jgi:hypothetical protein
MLSNQTRHVSRHVSRKLSRPPEPETGRIHVASGGTWFAHVRPHQLSFPDTNRGDVSMRRSLMTLVMTLGVLATGAAAANAQSFTLTAALTGSEETPTAVNTGAFGTATVTLDVGARTVTYRVEVFNLPSGVTASHIHAGGVGTTGPVIINFAPPVPASNDFGFGGTVSAAEWVMRPEQGIRSADDVIQAILGNNTYVNVHSSVNGGGEVRGRLVLKQP